MHTSQEQASPPVSMLARPQQRPWPLRGRGTADVGIGIGMAHLAVAVQCRQHDLVDVAVVEEVRLHVHRVLNRVVHLARGIWGAGGMVVTLQWQAGAGG